MSIKATALQSTYNDQVTSRKVPLKVDQRQRGLSQGQYDKLEGLEVSRLENSDSEHVLKDLFATWVWMPQRQPSKVTAVWKDKLNIRAIKKNYKKKPISVDPGNGPYILTMTTQKWLIGGAPAFLCP